MRLENAVVIAKREYKQRVMTKGFWLGTLLVPLFVASIGLLPTYLMTRSTASQQIVVVDETGQIGKPFAAHVNKEKPEAPKGAPRRGLIGDERKMAKFQVVEVMAPAADPAAQRAELDRRVQAKALDAWVWIPAGVLDGKKVEYHARNTSNVVTQSILRDELSPMVHRVRLRQAGLDPQRVEELTQRVELETQTISKDGRGGGLGGLLFALLLFLILYFAMLMWGQQVMNGVLEEKGSRVIEVLVSAVTPFELMMGKLVGICLVGLTQVGIWLGTMAVISAPGVAMAFLPGEAGIPQVTLAMFVHFILLFILGFFAFATIYATVGSAFNNLQEAQQAAGVVMVVIVIPAMVIQPIINDPNSTMAVVLSLIPLFTPLLMPLRIAIEMPPAWQLALAYVLTFAFIIGMVWFGSKIYRVGILMYGKKPTFQEIWKWTRYS